jgi:hypothetical protein
MFKVLSDNKGQGAAVQYSLTFFFILAVVAAMTVYFKRAIQGRIRDATVYMAQTATNEYIGCGEVTSQYEPYYADTVIDKVVGSTQSKGLLPSFNASASSGIYVHDENTLTQMQTTSNQAPPKEAK